MRSICARHVTQSLGLIACLSVLMIGASAPDRPKIRPVQSTRVKGSNRATSLIDPTNAAGTERGPIDCNMNGQDDACDIDCGETTFLAARWNWDAVSLNWHSDDTMKALARSHTLRISHFTLKSPFSCARVCCSSSVDRTSSAMGHRVQRKLIEFIAGAPSAVVVISSGVQRFLDA